jgi:hypothetical protein
MPMPLSNAPDTALAQEWFAALDAYVKAHGLRGYDPFDVKQHPWIRAAQPHYFPRKATTLLTDLFPKLTRRVLGIQPTENPKAFALVALGSFRMYQLTEDPAYLAQGRQMLDWLLAHATPGFAGLCWGYPFHVHAKGMDTPPGTPVGVVCSIAGHAFVEGHALTGDAAYRDAAVSIATFMLRDLPRMDAGDGTICFGYTPGDRRRVHNANLLIAEHLLRVWGITKDQALYDAAQPAIAFTLQRQQPDGAWTYGEYDPAEPFEAGLLHMIDNHHTGFVLRSLNTIHVIEPRPEIKEAIRKGWTFYRTLFTPLGMPVNGYGKWPVDIHACTEGLLCASALKGMVLGTRRMAYLTLRWPHYFLRNRKDDTPYYRKYPGFTVRILFPRWGLAWMYYALAEYLYQYAADDGE